jgi:cobalt-zinc-cadmium efflux system outer membrane protein
MALERNREFLALKQRVAEAQALMRQAGIRPTPALEFQGSTGRLLGTEGEEEYSAGYFHTIETFGKRTKRIHVAAKSVELAEAELAEKRRQLAFEVKTRFAEAIAAERKLAAINRLIETHRGNYRLVEARVREGDAALLEQQLLLTELNRSQAQQAAFSGRSGSALLELKKALGLGSADPLSVGNDFGLETDPPTLAELQKQALESRPELKVFRILEDQANAEAELARAEGKPDLTASLRYVRRNSQFDALGFSRSGALVPLRDRDNIIAFGVSIPVFTGRRTQGAVAAALSRNAAARLHREFLEASIPLEVEAAYQRWQGAQHSLAILKTGVMAQSEKNLAVIREAYRLGQLRVTDVLNEQRRLIETELGYIDSQSEMVQAFAELEKSVGGHLR